MLEQKRYQAEFLELAVCTLAMNESKIGHAVNFFLKKLGDNLD